MYSIAYENKDIVIRFDEDSVDKKLLTNFLEFIELEQIRKKSQLTEEQIEKLSKKINKKVWNQLKTKVLRVS